MKKAILILIISYQKTISLDHGVLSRVYPGSRICRFHPSCSEYAYGAVERYGVLKGIWLAAKRLAHCHPWNRGGYDPVPEKKI